jgi:hypothetical protein
VSKCWKQEKSNWNCLGSSSQESAQSGSTGLSGGAPDSVRCARLTRSELAALGNSPATYDYNSPDCPLCTGLSGEPTVGGQRSPARSAWDTWPSQRLEGGTGLSGVYRTCPVRQRLSGGQRSTSLEKERNRAPDSVRCAPDCPVRHATEGKICLPGMLSTAPSCRGAIKGTPRRMEEDTNHPLSTIDHSHIILAHLFAILVI